MLKINTDYKYHLIIQIPDNPIKENLKVMFYFHGSMSGDKHKYYENVQKIFDEYKNGRFKFSEQINNSTIIITPVIYRDEVFLSNGLEVDPQRFSRGCIHKLCKTEFPDYYAPHLEIKKIFDNLPNIVGSKYQIEDKYTLMGISAGGSFASTFSLLYPDKIKAYLSFLDIQLFVPETNIQNLNLPFPFGMYGLNDCPDINITEDKINLWKKLPKFYFTDSDDTQSSLEFDIDKDFYESYTKIFGKKLDEILVNSVIYYKEYYNNNINYLITKGNKHSIPTNIFDDTIEKYLNGHY